MRQIKFRAWDKVINRWVYLPETGEINLEQNYGEIIYLSYDNENIELMQFTGLLDKNGKGIYEGDIVRVVEFIDGNFVQKVFHNYQIVFEYFSFTMKPILKTAQWTASLIIGNNAQIEVIGNVFENPELLEEKK